MKFVLPGDFLPEIEHGKTTKGKILLGPGLRHENNKVYATRPGVLKQESENVFYVDTMSKRYLPNKREFVIGIVVKKKGENYLIDIAGPELATLSCLSFENASKKTRKEMQVGDLVYAQLLVANKDMEPELVCIDVYDRSAGMGVLPEKGHLFTVPLHVSRQLVDPNNPFLLQISKKFPYSIVVGSNGRIYVRAGSNREMLAVMHAVYMVETMGLSEALANLNKLLTNFLNG